MLAVLLSRLGLPRVTPRIGQLGRLQGWFFAVFSHSSHSILSQFCAQDYVWTDRQRNLQVGAQYGH